MAISVRQLRSFTKLGLIRYVSVGLGTRQESRRYRQADIDAFIEHRLRQYAAPQDVMKRSVTGDETRERLQSLLAKKLDGRRSKGARRPAEPIHK